MKRQDDDKRAEYSAVYKRKREKKPVGGKILIVLLAVTAAVLVAAVVVMSLYFTGAFDATGRKEFSEKGQEEPVVYENFLSYTFSSTLPSGYYANFTLEAEGKEYKFSAYLFSVYAPNTVSNFISYAQAGYYNGTTFKDSRLETDDAGVTKGAVTCGGYVRNAGGDVSYKVPTSFTGPIEGEFAANGHAENRLNHDAGVLGMIHSNASYDDATTDFYLLSYADESLNGHYAAFAKITTAGGLSAARTLARLAADGTPVTIKTVTITQKK